MIGTADNIGGAAKQSWSLGHELKNRGYEVKWLVRTKGSNKGYVHGFYNNLQTNVSHIKNFLLSNDIEFGLGKEILNHSWYKNADLIHLHNLHGNYFNLSTLIKISKEKKLIWTLHDMWAITGKSPYIIGDKENNWQYPPMLLDTHKKLIEKKQRIYKNIKNLTIVTPSLWLNKLTKNSNLKSFPIRTIYNGIDTSFFIPKKHNNKKYIITSIISGGFDSPFKGGELIKKLIPLIKENEKLELHFVGGDKLNNNKNIFYHGKLESNDLKKQYQKSDVVLVPSLADNCPTVVLEALSCGIPVIATKVGGIPELIKHKINGYLTLPNVNSINLGLQWIVNLDEKSRKNIKDNNRELALKKFSIKNMTDEYESIYLK